MSDILGSLLSQVTKSDGLKGLVSKLMEGGLGDQVKSWIAPGSNQPVSADQVKDALGQEQVNKLAEQAGTTPDEAASQLAQKLPNAVDQLTPDGTVPSADSVKDQVGKLFSSH
ncbi:MAG TPA: YidB family protein [Actinospica sp.]|nr:YidB family protein [Actinospica sp.]